MPRPRTSLTPAHMVAAARMYHLEDLSKSEIATKLGIDRRHVAELLIRARQEGLIRFDIFQSAAQEIERQLGERYPHLKKIIVRPGTKITSPDQYPGHVKQMGIGAAEFFEDLPGYFPRRVNLNIGVTGGRHVLSLANALPNRERHNIYIQIPGLIGRGHDPKSTHVDPIVNASLLWGKCGYLPGHCSYTTVPPYPPAQPGPKARKAARTQIETVARNKAVSEVILAMDKIDVAFTGIGSVNPSVPSALRKVVAYSLLEHVVTLPELEAEGAVGSMGYCYFDEFGNGREDWRFWLTAGHCSERDWGVEFYKRMVESNRIVVAFGNPFDIRPTVTALRAQMFNVLVTDEYSAKQILEAE
jgi:DNA-binding transcriptional regulator LsrR (DeoR family)